MPLLLGFPPLTYHSSFLRSCGWCEKTALTTGLSWTFACLICVEGIYCSFLVGLLLTFCPIAMVMVNVGSCGTVRKRLFRSLHQQQVLWAVVIFVDHTFLRSLGVCFWLLYLFVYPFPLMTIQ